MDINNHDKASQNHFELACIYSTVNQFCNRHPAFTKGGMRYIIFNEQTNGLAESGAIVRMGRKILIQEKKFFSWLESNQGGEK